MQARLVKVRQRISAGSAAPRDQQVCDPMRQGIGLAGTGPRQKQEVVRQVFHSELLLFVEGDGGWHGGTSLAFDRNGQGRFLFDLG